jgi:NAD-dependent dihydropyrimidine dehydrogenase PreA subunit
MPEVKVDQEKCTGCGTCVDVCPVEVFELKEEGGKSKSFPTKQEECLVCRACETQCPENAIQVTE